MGGSYSDPEQRSTDSLPRRTILSIDADLDSRDLRSRTLRAAGFDVVEASSGAEALKLARAMRPSLVLCKVLAPEADWFSVCRLLKADPETSSIPLLHIAEHDVSESLKDECGGCLREPVDPQVLVASAEALIRSGAAAGSAADREAAAILESISEAYLACDRDFRIMYVNAEAERLLGKKREDLLGRSHWEVFPRSFDSKLGEECRRVMAEGEPSFFEYRAEPEGRWYTVRLFPAGNGGITAYLRDVTAQKQDESSVARSPRARKYLVAVLCVLVAAFLRSVLAPFIGATDSPLLFFAFAIAAAAQYGGAPAGLLATALGLLTSAYFFFEPYFRLHNIGADDLVLLGLFGGTGVFISVLGERLQRAKRGRLAAEKSETRHRELVEQLQLSTARLEEDRRLFRALMDYIPEGLTIVDAPYGKIRMESRHGLQIMGLHESIAGRTVEEMAQAVRLFRPDGVTPLPLSEIPALRALNGEVVQDSLVVLEGPGGEKRWLMFDAGPIRGPDGAVSGSVMGWRDVTESRRHQEALRESEDRLSLAIGSTELGAFDYNPQTGGLVWSGYAKRHLGLAPEDEPTYDLFLRALHPGDRERVERTIQEAMHGVSGGQYAAEYRTIGLRDGMERWISDRGRAYFDDRGRPVRFIGVTLDITARKRMEERLRESEERYRRLFESNVVGMVTANEESVLEANDIFLNMVGYTSEDLAEGRIRWREMTPPEYQDAADRAVSEVLNTGACGPFEKEYFRKDGARVPVLLGGVLLERTPPRWLCFILDQTERKQLERKILEAQKLESIGMLAAGIAHDFNNLLVGVIGNAALAKEMLPPGDPLGELLDRVVVSGEQAADLTRQMLAYAGKGRFVVRPVNLSEIVPEAIKLLEPSLSGNVVLELDLQPDLPLVEADRAQMQQVVANLVLNAAEAIGGDPGRITIRTALQEVDAQFVRRELHNVELRPGEYVRVDVCDTGSGMDEATKARIFDPFFSTKFTGRGLGLAAVAGIVRSHKGAVGVRSTPGEGSCFRVLFPVSGRGAPAPPVAAPADQALHGGGTILVVDDEQVVREMAGKSLEMHGYRVLLADSGRAGIDTLRKHPGTVDLVLLDLSMPGMSGEEALPELWKVRPEVKVMISSGYSEAETMKLFQGYRISGFLQKPYTPGEIAEKVRSVLSAVPGIS